MPDDLPRDATRPVPEPAPGPARGDEPGPPKIYQTTLEKLLGRPPLVPTHGRPHGYHLYRLTSDLHEAERLEIQVERDAALVALAACDRELLALATRRRILLRELDEHRELLWPRLLFCRVARPPALDHPPLPPAIADPIPIKGQQLRVTCLALLERHGPQQLRDLHALLHVHGYVLFHHHPVKALADALGHETDAGRAQRIRRGVYALADGYRPRAPRRRPSKPSPNPAPSAGSGIAVDTSMFTEPVPGENPWKRLLGTPSPPPVGEPDGPDASDASDEPVAPVAPVAEVAEVAEDGPAGGAGMAPAPGSPPAETAVARPATTEGRGAEGSRGAPGIDDATPIDPELQLDPDGWLDAPDFPAVRARARP